METKTDWYRKLIRKLNNIKSGKLDIDEYIDEVKSKIEAESQALSMSGVSNSACGCDSEWLKLHCANKCDNKNWILKS